MADPMRCTCQAGDGTDECPFYDDCALAWHIATYGPIPLAETQPLEYRMREQPGRNDNFEGACWFGNREYNPGPTDGSCRKDPAPGSLTGLCVEHRDLLRAWSAGEDMPDPRPPRPLLYTAVPDRDGHLPDMYLGGNLWDGSTGLPWPEAA